MGNTKCFVLRITKQAKNTFWNIFFIVNTSILHLFINSGVSRKWGRGVPKNYEFKYHVFTKILL